MSTCIGKQRSLLFIWYGGEEGVEQGAQLAVTVLHSLAIGKELHEETLAGTPRALSLHLCIYLACEEEGKEACVALHLEVGVAQPSESSSQLAHYREQYEQVQPCSPCQR
jgi:hypothetical protein